MKYKIKLKRKKFLYLFLALVFILIISCLGGIIRSSFLAKTENTQKNLWEKGRDFSFFFSNLFFGQNLKEENEILKKENQRLLSEIIELKEIKEENEELRKALELGLKRKLQFVDAFVIAKEINEDAVFINKGKRDGIKENSIVITPQKALIGRVSKVYNGNSLVKLITHPEVKFNIEIGESKIEGVAKGNGNFKLLIEKLPKEKEVEINDLIITGRFQKDLPYGLLIGKVKSVKRTDLDPFQKIEVEPFFSLDDLRTVFVITDF
jgi:rod shape-determining protein MreC